MLIVIPTRNRVGKQLTLDSLTVGLRAKTVLVCPESEVRRHTGRVDDSVELLAQPDENFTIAQKRKWIVEHFHRKKVQKIIMLDDDLRFYCKRDDDPKLIRQAEKSDVDRWFGELFEVLSPEIPHDSIHSRMGSQQWTHGWRTGRAMYVLGYYLPIVAKRAVFGRIETREDMDVTLQLLSAGYPNAVCTSFISEQRAGWGGGVGNTIGGCDGQRTIKSSDADADRLAELHPGLVRVVEKQYRASVPRKEVVCAWGNALRDGQQRRYPDGCGDEVRAPGALGRSPAVRIAGD